MGAALVRGAVAAKVLHGDGIHLFDVDGAKAASLAEATGASVAPSLESLVERSGIVLLATKPQVAPQALAALRPAWSNGKALLSVCAGLATGTMERALQSDAVAAPRVVRSMPNTPALIGAGATAIAAGAHATAEDLTHAAAIFSAVGIVETVPESQLDCVTGLSGSGPAYAFLLMEAMIAGAVAQGLDEAVAARLVKQTVRGAGMLATAPGAAPPAELRRAVTSPGGTTEAGLRALQERGFSEAVAACIAAATARGKELGRAAENR